MGAPRSWFERTVVLPIQDQYSKMELGRLDEPSEGDALVAAPRSGFERTVVLPTQDRY